MNEQLRDQIINQIVALIREKTRLADDHLYYIFPKPYDYEVCFAVASYFGENQNFHVEYGIGSSNGELALRINMLKTPILTDSTEGYLLHNGDETGLVPSLCLAYDRAQLLLLQDELWDENEVWFQVAPTIQIVANRSKLNTMVADRRYQHHVSFGYGIHLGSGLSRIVYGGMKPINFVANAYDICRPRSVLISSSEGVNQDFMPNTMMVIFDGTTPPDNWKGQVKSWHWQSNSVGFRTLILK